MVLPFTTRKYCIRNRTFIHGIQKNLKIHRAEVCKIATLCYFLYYFVDISNIFVIKLMKSVKSIKKIKNKINIT